MEQAESTVQIENELIRVTEWRLAPGTSTGHHRHEHDYVVVPIVGGRLTLVDSSGEHPADLAPGKSYAREKGVEHNVLNSGEQVVIFIEIELK
jgi:quercetin dioxygenase-like cupin family protein